MSTCLVEFSLKGKKKTLEVSELQALALLCFNDDACNSGVTVAAIAHQTGIEMDELTGIIQSLAYGKVDKKSGTTRVLRKKGGEVSCC